MDYPKAAKYKQHGFTLIELMIVVAIISILAVVAIPMYQDYAIRTKVVEGFGLMSATRTTVSEYFIATNEWPYNNAEAGTFPPQSIGGAYVSTITVLPPPGCTASPCAGTVSGSQIEIEYVVDEGLNGNTIVIDAYSRDGGSVGWDCSTSDTTMPQQYLPPNCR